MAIKLQALQKPYTVFLVQTTDCKFSLEYENRNDQNIYDI